MPASVDPSASNRPHPRPGREEDPPQEPLHDAARRVAELRSYVAYYIETRLDRLKLTVRNIVVLAILGVLGLIAGGAIVVTAAVQLMQGIAGGLAALFGGRGWLGDLVCAVVILGLIAVAVLIGISRLTKTSRSQTVGKYERRKEQQRHDLGADVQQRSRDSVRSNGH